MKRKARIKRPKPARTEPIRSWSTLFVPPGAAAGANGGGSTGRGAATLEDVVSRSVDLGYRVVDEYVRQGQKAARRLGARSWEPDAITRDAQDVMARMMQYGSDFVSVWWEFMELTTGGPGRGLGALLPPTVPAPDTAPAPRGEAREPERPERTRVRVALASVQPADVSLDLRPDAARLPVVVHALRAVDPKKPRLTDVAVERATGDGPLVVRVRVPADQPSGVYNGMIIDEKTSRPVGTLSVRIGASG